MLDTTRGHEISISQTAFGLAIKSRLSQSGMSQRELAVKLGMDETRLSRLITGSLKIILFADVLKLSEIFGVGPQALYEDTVRIQNSPVLQEVQSARTTIKNTRSKLKKALDF